MSSRRKIRAFPTMTTPNESSSVEIDGLDPAAVFGAAMSLWEACEASARNDSKLNLSESYHGMDELMRQVMRVATLFESWCCEHLDFDQFSDVWPYFLEDKFGEACLAA